MDELTGLAELAEFTGRLGAVIATLIILGRFGVWFARALQGLMQDQITAVRTELAELRADRDRWTADREMWQTDRLGWQGDRERWDADRVAWQVERDSLMAEIHALRSQVTALEAELHTFTGVVDAPIYGPPAPVPGL